jgi:hypothetical protein
MTTPDIVFESNVPPAAAEVVSAVKPTDKFPPPIIPGFDVNAEVAGKETKFRAWLDEWIESLLASQKPLMDTWVDIEKAYRAQRQAWKTIPYEGAAREVTPVMAMAVDPIHARLDTGIFKQDPVFALKGLKRSILKYIPALSQFIDYQQKHRLKLREVYNPRLMENTKLGTMVLKTIFDREETPITGYVVNDDGEWKVKKRKILRYSGPKVFGLSLGDFFFPPNYQRLQDCPIVMERIRTTYLALKVAEANDKVVGVDKIKDQATHERTVLEDERARQTGHEDAIRQQDDLVVYEIWCKYDIDDDGLPEPLVVTYHKNTQTILQLRYNWYDHGEYPHTVIPYTITNDSLYGMGIGEMVLPFQEALTAWDQMARDNAYIANIRMFIVKKGSAIEEVPRLYPGRCFFVDDPKSDFVPFGSGEIYPSTLTERQNLFGLVEKRTGVSDYLTGRESPIIGSRATATSTLALIQEGTRRVEEVLENIRAGSAEVLMRCMQIWMQYGVDEIDEMVFEDDPGFESDEPSTVDLLREFFTTVKPENLNGAIAIDLAATDASGSRQAMQQLQLQIIQIMMTYLEKVLEAGSLALQAKDQMPEFVEMVKDVMTKARNMFKDLLQKYDVRNPEDYLPDIEDFLDGGQGIQATAGPNGVGGPQNPLGIASGRTGIQGGTGLPIGPAVPRPGAPGEGTSGF